MEEKKIIITFSMQDDVIAFNRFAKKNNLNGKIIHIPSSITAGCGLSYELDISYKNKIKNILDENKIFYENIFEI